MPVSGQVLPRRVILSAPLKFSRNRSISRVGSAQTDRSSEAKHRDGTVDEARKGHREQFVFVFRETKQLPSLHVNPASVAKRTASLATDHNSAST